MSANRRWEAEDWADTMIAYGADPDVLYEYEFEPIRVKMIRNVLRLRGATGDRMFKKVAYSDTRLAFVHGIIEYIYRRGYSNVPRFIRNKYGDAYIIDSTGQYYMTDWLPGRELEVRKPQQLEWVAENLARFHKLAAGYEASEPIFESKDDMSTQWRRYLAKLQSYRQAILQKGKTDEFDKLFLENWKYLVEMIEDALFQLHHSPYPEVIANARAQQQICHGSVSRQNILIDAENMYFVDFDHCHYGPVIQDLASFLHRYMPRCEWDEDVVLGIIDKYHEVRPLSREELHVLNIYLQFPVRPVQVIEWYYEKLRNWDVQRFEEELLKSLDRDEDRDDFIDIMAEYYGIEFYDGTDAVNQAQTNPTGPAYAAANQETFMQEPLFTTAADTRSAPSDQIPIAWSAESSSVNLLDDEEDSERERPLFKGSPPKQSRSRKQKPARQKPPEPKEKNDRVKQEKRKVREGIWVDSEHIHRPAKRYEGISED